LSPNEPKSSDTKISAFSGEFQSLMSQETTVTWSPHNSSCCACKLCRKEKKLHQYYYCSSSSSHGHVWWCFWSDSYSIPGINNYENFASLTTVPNASISSSKQILYYSQYPFD
jgi:hypothetical protein